MALASGRGTEARRTPSAATAPPTLPSHTTGHAGPPAARDETQSRDRKTSGPFGVAGPALPLAVLPLAELFIDCSPMAGRLPRAIAEFSTSALDGHGLRCHLPTRPV